MTPEITKLKIKTEFVDAKKWEGRSITISMKSIYEYLITMNIYKTVVNVSISYNENVFSCPMVYINGNGKIPVIKQWTKGNIMTIKSRPRFREVVKYYILKKKFRNMEWL